MRLAIYCAGGLGREVLDLARQLDRWEEIFFVDDITEEISVHGARVLRLPEVEPMRGEVEFIIATGEPSAREALYNRVLAAGYELTSLIASGARIGSGTQLGRGVIAKDICITTDITIGDNVLLNGRVNIGHDGVIGDHTVLSNDTNFGGGVVVGRRAFVGMGAIVKERITIGDDSIVSMGAVVYRSVPPETIVLGNPAKVIAKNMEHRVFGI